MSLKPPKKSDLGKSWMKGRKDRAKRIQPEYHLIVTEGTETEPAYFGAMRDAINIQFREKVHLEISGQGSNTVHLAQTARQMALASANIYRHVWVVFDTDDFSSKNIDRTVELCKEYSNEETEFHAVWSNQCIELWYLLHFSFMQSDYIEDNTGKSCQSGLQA